MGPILLLKPYSQCCRNNPVTAQFFIKMSRYALSKIFLLLSFTIALLCSLILVFSFMYVITYFTLLVLACTFLSS